MRIPKQIKPWVKSLTGAILFIGAFIIISFLYQEVDGQLINYGEKNASISQ